MKFNIELEITCCGDCPFCECNEDLDPNRADGGYYCIFPESDVGFIHHCQSRNTVIWKWPNNCPLRKYESV
jgi:hypothetical protein